MTMEGDNIEGKGDKAEGSAVEKKGKKTGWIGPWRGRREVMKPERQGG